MPVRKAGLQPGEEGGARYPDVFLASGPGMRQCCGMSEFIQHAQAATAAMREVFAATPLQRNAHLSDRFGAEIWLKREDLSPVRSYKIRGALNAMRKQPDQALFVCASAGNHAQGVAFMCRQMDKQGVIFMPVTTPQQKIRKTRMFGGDKVQIHLVGDYFDQTLKAAQDWCAREGGHFLAPFDDADVIEGQASIAVEIAEDLGRAPDFIILPVGGGGMSSGVSRYFGRNTRCIFVEPQGGLPAGGPGGGPSGQAGTGGHICRWGGGGANRRPDL